jgi:thiol-disulfide isomerase/thioredoxin
MKYLLLFFLCVLMQLRPQAQPADGTFAPNFILQDIKGTSHELYRYLDSGYTVLLDFSTTWCAPCWSFHEAGTFKTLYDEYGPHSKANSMRFFMIECDPYTKQTDLEGKTSNSKGDWITGTPYPIIDLKEKSVATAYDVYYLPTIMVVCPNRQVKNIGFKHISEFVKDLPYCDQKVARDDHDASLMTYMGDTVTCNEAPVRVRLANNGKQVLKKARIRASKAGEPELVMDWEGNLKTYEVTDLHLGNFPFSTQSNIKIQITTEDNNLSNNTLEKTIRLPNNIKSKNPELLVYTDRKGSEVSWKIFKPSGELYLSGGPYKDEEWNDTFLREKITLSLPENGCYRLEIYDSGKDGIGRSGHIRIEDPQGGLPPLYLIGFKGEAHGYFGYYLASGSRETTEFPWRIYPNPGTDVLYIESDTPYHIALCDLQGKRTPLTAITTEGQSVVDISSFPKGVYFLEMSDEKSRYHKKIVIQR